MPDDDTLVGGHRWTHPEQEPPAELPPVLYADPTPTALLDAATAKAVRAFFWTVCYLLWFGVAVTIALMVLFVVAVANNGIPGG